MTRVYAQADRGRYLLAAQGHATGSPEVCAAVSAIVYTLAGYLANTQPDQGKGLRLDSGDVLLKWDYRGGRGQTAFELTVIGLKQLEAQYPQYVQVECEEL